MAAPYAFAEPETPSALRLARGVGRLFAAQGYASVTELVLPTGRRVDVAALGGGGELVFVEIKTSLADFRADLKWESYRDYCDRLFFAVSPDFPRAVIPETAGLIIADDYGGEILRDNATQPLAGARRKAMLLRFAWHAANKLQRLTDPGFV
jgi:hypothetical protein